MRKETIEKHTRTLYEYLREHGPQFQDDLKGVIPDYAITTVLSFNDDKFIRMRLGNNSNVYSAHDLFESDYVNRYIWGIRGDERFLDMIADGIKIEPSTLGEVRAITTRIRGMLGNAGHVKVMEKIGYDYSERTLMEYGVI